MLWEAWGVLSLRLRPDHGSPWRDPHFTDCVEEDRPVWRRPTPVAEESLWLGEGLLLSHGTTKQRAALEAGRPEVERSPSPYSGQIFLWPLWIRRRRHFDRRRIARNQRLIDHSVTLRKE
jgi:hypothetical protein